MGEDEGESDKKVVGLIERVKLKGENGEIEVMGLFDTGATRTSVDSELVKKLGFKRLNKKVKVKSKTSPEGYVLRDLYKGEIEIKGKNFEVSVNSTDRSNMPYPVLIGRDIIHNNFVIDVSLTHKSHKIRDLR